MSEPKKQTAKAARGGGASGKGGGGRQAMRSQLQTLFQSILGAIQLAHTKSEVQHQRQLERYSHKRTGNEPLRPKTMELQIDTPGGESRNISVPLLALSPPSSLSLKELQMEFQVELVGLEGKDGVVAVKIGSEAGIESAMAKIKVTVAEVEPPDAVSRIIEVLTRQMI